MFAIWPTSVWCFWRCFSTDGPRQIERIADFIIPVMRLGFLITEWINENWLIYTGFTSAVLWFMYYKITYCNLKYLYEKWNILDYVFKCKQSRCRDSCYYWTLNLAIIGHSKIIIEYYWNETFVFVDCSKLIRTITDRYTVIKVDGQDREQ